MTPARSLHDLIAKYNFLQKPTLTLDRYFRNHPTFYKIALLANHFFRAITMAAFMSLLCRGSILSLR